MGPGDPFDHNRHSPPRTTPLNSNEFHQNTTLLRSASAIGGIAGGIVAFMWVVYGFASALAVLSGSAFGWLMVGLATGSFDIRGALTTFFRR